MVSDHTIVIICVMKIFFVQFFCVFSVCFQGKPINITVIQAYAPTSNAEEAKVERFYEDLQDLLELTPKKDVLSL